MSDAEKSDPATLVLTRTFAAPRSLVFRAWTEPERAAAWWGPQGFGILSCEMDPRPGGAWRMRLRSADGSIHVKQGVWREIVPGMRLVFTWQWLDPSRLPRPETIVTVTFEDHGGGTKLTLHQAALETVEVREEHRSGWSGCMDRFAAYLAHT
jgi:uncharacterized protein YndB with AHSA1/START domain